MARSEYEEVTNFAIEHLGDSWLVTSVDAFRFKDSGSVQWIVFLQRKPDVYFSGEDSQACLCITLNESGFLARPVEKQRLFYRIAKGTRKSYKKSGNEAWKH